MVRRIIGFFALVAICLVLVFGVSSTLAATGDPVLLNEVLASHTGTDDTEYVELYGDPGQSLAGLSVIVVESDAFSGNHRSPRRFFTLPSPRFERVLPVRQLRRAG